MNKLLQKTKAWAAALSLIVPFAAVALPTPAPDDNLNAEFQIRSVTPENCSLVEELTTITILYDTPANSWSPEIQGEYAPDLWNPEMPYKKLEVTRKGKTVSTLSVEGCYTSYGPTTLNLIFTLDTPLTADGTYQIVIPDKYIVDGANNSTGKQTLKYQIGEGDPEEEEPEEPEVPLTGVFRLDSMTPASGEMIEELSFVSAKWLDSNDEPCVWDGPEYILLTAKEPSYGFYTVGKAKVSSGNGNIYFTLSRAYSAYGTVYLTIPAGAVKSADGKEGNEEEISLDFPIFYTRGAVCSYTYPGSFTTIDGKMGQSMQNIALTYPQSMSVGTGDMPYMVTEDGEIYDCTSINIPPLEPSSPVINFDEADSLPKGTYSIVVPHNALSGASGFSFYYNFIPIPAQEVPEVPEGTILKMTKCTIDGYDMLDPENGMPALAVDANLAISTNLDYASDVCWYKILDVTDCRNESEYDSAPAIHSSYLDRAGGTYSGIILSPGNLVRNLTADRLYCVQAHLYMNYYNASARRDWGYCYSAVFHGGSTPYPYADIDVRIQPQPGNELKSGTPIVMTFAEPVTFRAENSGIPLGQEGTLEVSTTSNADKTVWTITLPESAFSDSKIEVHLGFNSIATGNAVRPSGFNVPESETVNASVFNYDIENRSQIVVVYGSFDGKPEFSVEPKSGSQVNLLNDFTYSFDDGDIIMPSWMGEAVVRDEDGTAVARLVCDDLEENGGHVKVDYDNPNAADAKALAVHLSLDNPITKAGTYTVEYPYGYFNKGSEHDSDFTRPAEHTYIVTGQGTTDIRDVTVENETYTVVSLQGVTLLRNGNINDVLRLPAGLYIINGKKQILK